MPQSQGRLSLVGALLALMCVTRGASAADPELLHVIGYGQSLSIGALATPAISTAPQSDVMFVGGVRPQDSGSDPTTVFGSLVPLVEADHINEYGTTVLGETPTSGMLEEIRALSATEGAGNLDLSNALFLGSAPGTGGQTIAQLSFGNVPFTRLVQSIYYGNLRAAEISRHYHLSAITWTQGEADYWAGTSATTYADAMESLRLSIENWEHYLTGETTPVPMISYQLSSHIAANVTYPTIALAQTNAAASHPHIYLAAPTYMFDYADNFHLTATSSKWLGAYYGIAYKRIVADGIDWQPLQPISAAGAGNQIKVRFHVPVPPLALDTTQVSNPGQYGFTLIDATGHEIPLTSVTIAATDTLILTTKRRIPSGSHLHYAFKGGVQTGRLTGPRGNLRDSQGDTVVFEPSSLNKRMDNWCVIFDIAVTV